MQHVLSGLTKRRAEMAGEIEATHTKLKGLLEALANLDATIVQLIRATPLRASGRKPSGPRRTGPTMVRWRGWSCRSCGRRGSR